MAIRPYHLYKHQMPECFAPTDICGLFAEKIAVSQIKFWSSY
ncbi:MULTISPECIES: hypothetical protein [Planktothricoides]|nr:MULTISPECIES: hypothetical protein [Planktothricoides]